MYCPATQGVSYFVISFNKHFERILRALSGIECALLGTGITMNTTTLSCSAATLMAFRSLDIQDEIKHHNDVNSRFFSWLRMNTLYQIILYITRP